ncbi:MAG: DsbA family protein [Crocinitomix sp.]|nr:DsbA family protein [Crocinitomix sp.]
MNYDWLNDDRDALIYVGDAMCSWCHGIAPELDQLKNDHSDLDFKLVMGGLRPYNTEKAIDMADFLKSHWVEIEERTGQPFTHDILKDPDFVYDTEPASRAVVVARMMNPAIEYDFFKAVQMAFYRDNFNTNNVATYLPLASEFGLDPVKFEELFNSNEAKEHTKGDFQITQQMGINSFPSMVLKKKGQFTLIAKGYQKAADINKIIASL